jgi:phosphopantetheinyl transferase
MTPVVKTDADWLAARFSDCVLDWTAPAARHLACVRYLPVSRDPEAAKRCAALLSPAERRTAERFLSQDDRARFEQRRAFRRWCGTQALGSVLPMTEIAFAETWKGRPYLRDAPSIRFSFSACRRGFLGAWSSTHAIGVDIEDPGQAIEATDLARAFFTEAEAEAVREAPSRTFFRLWTLKEAALKSVGEGLPMGLDTFEFELVPTVRVVRAPSSHGGPERFRAFSIGGVDQRAALVVRIR